MYDGFNSISSLRDLVLASVYDLCANKMTMMIEVSSWSVYKLTYETEDICRLSQMLPGDCGFIAQLNEGRHLQKRPTEFRIDQVLQPFDPKKFNFTKVGQEEVLFQFMPNDSDMSEYYEKATVSSSPNVVAINVRFNISEISWNLGCVFGFYSR